MKHLRAVVPAAVLLEDPLFSQRNPHQAFLIGLSIVASLPLLRGNTQSALLERELDNTTVMVWGFALLAGSLLALLGEFWPGRTYTALVIERGGLGLVGGAAAIYGEVAWGSVGHHSPLSEVVPWALVGAMVAGCAVAVTGAYRELPYTLGDLGYRTAVAILVGLLVGAYAGSVWHTHGAASGVTYVVSIQAAYAGACLWRCAQITGRLRWLRQLRAAHDLELAED